MMPPKMFLTMSCAASAKAKPPIPSPAIIAVMSMPRLSIPIMIPIIQITALMPLRIIGSTWSSKSLSDFSVNGTTYSSTTASSILEIIQVMSITNAKVASLKRSFSMPLISPPGPVGKFK